MSQRYKIERDGQTIEVIAQKIKGKLWFHLDGRTQVFEPMTDAKGKVAKLAGDRVLAPMPGKILRVEVTSQDEVTVGQVLVVMEAMKMEYTLKSEVAGQVEEVACKALEQVKLGQLLVKIKEATHD
jgi:acetyl/propionyl-CoA carboxylase alpha subunit